MKKIIKKKSLNENEKKEFKETDKSDLELFKQRYSKLEKKFGLPSFKKLNEDFEIEKLNDRESECLLRDIRHAISEKLSAFLRFLESVLNPVVSPVFILQLLKGVDKSTKEIIESSYKNLVAIELGSVNLDIEYDEKKEAEFIKIVFKKWHSLKPSLRSIFENLRSLHKQSFEKKDRSYLG